MFHLTSDSEILVLDVLLPDDTIEDSLDIQGGSSAMHSASPRYLKSSYSTLSSSRIRFGASSRSWMLAAALVIVQIYPDPQSAIYLHSMIPLVPFPGLVHPGITLSFFVLGGRHGEDGLQLILLSLRRKHAFYECAAVGRIENMQPIPFRKHRRIGIFALPGFQVQRRGEGSTVIF